MSIVADEVILCKSAGPSELGTEVIEGDGVGTKTGEPRVEPVSCTAPVGDVGPLYGRGVDVEPEFLDLDLVVYTVVLGRFSLTPTTDTTASVIQLSVEAADGSCVMVRVTTSSTSLSA